MVHVIDYPRAALTIAGGEIVLYLKWPAGWVWVVVAAFVSLLVCGTARHEGDR